MNTHNASIGRRRFGGRPHKKPSGSNRVRSYSDRGESGQSEPRSYSYGGGFRAGRGGGFRGGRSGGGGNRNRRAQPTFNPAQFIQKNPQQQQTQEVAYVPVHAIQDLPLHDTLKHNIEQAGIKVLTPIQDKIIPAILEGRDVLGLAETGTGKTAAFLIPCIQRSLEDSGAQTLVLTPTRELAIQINTELLRLGKNQRMFSTLCVGGVPIGPQISSLRRENQFIIGTPGRVMDLIRKRAIVPTEINTLVLDEADRMLDMGFINDIKSVVAMLPKERTTLLLSATSTPRTDTLAHSILKNPLTVSVKKRDVISTIEQSVVWYTHNRKFEELHELLTKPEYKRVIIFGAMKHSVEELSRRLTQSGVRADSIHGNKKHRQRQRALDSFKKGEVTVLVATDVAARGIHVDNVSHVINYDLPHSFEDYVHRIGRTGRGTNQGKALTFVMKHENAR